ncbi:PhoH family protein, partial [Escherichia coli]|uniref:PhoH family protein n=1 Tax=Escherichia coli TaxID=562 RepID=UPI0014126C1E
VPENGLEWVTRKLRGCSNDIQVIEFKNKDVVRSEIVQTILRHLDSPDARAVEPKAKRHEFRTQDPMLLSTSMQGQAVA